jgi:amino acid adenylation domain-containing protein
MSSAADKRRELFARLLEQEGLSASQAIVPRAEQGPCPLASAQLRMWFFNQFDSGSPAYNIPVALRLTGPVQVAVLEHSLSEIARRHGTLRTIFRTAEAGPCQIVTRAPKLPLPFVDLGDIRGRAGQGEADRQMGAEARRIFGLDEGPCFRAALVRLSPDNCLLLVTMHHIISDGWSIVVLMSELAALYASYSGGECSQLPELPIQYTDFALWERDWLDGRIIQERLAYWQQKLAGAPAGLALPTDKLRPSRQTFAGRREPLIISQAVSRALVELAHQERATPFMVVLAAFKTLLSRYSGQQDVIVGSPVANRTRVETEGLIGLFVNSLVLRSDLSGNPAFVALLQRVRQMTLEAYGHADLPFEKLVDGLQIERDPSHPPVFQVLVVLQDSLTTPLRLPGITVSLLGEDTGTAKFDLTLYLENRAEGLGGWLEFNTDLFDAATIGRLGRHFQVLLSNIVHDSERLLSELNILTESDRHHCLVEWNDTGREYARGMVLQGFFEQQARRAPDRVAVIFEQQVFTYDELDRRANQVARHLERVGAGRGSLVAIMTDRSAEMVVGLLGILKSGAGYVPLDPSYPEQRLAFMLADSQASILLTEQRLIGSLPEGSAQTVCIDADWGAISIESAEQGAADSDDVAYVIYTSGSTGEPKGVAIKHHSVCTLLDWAQQIYSSDELAAVLASTSICFDLSIFEIFLPLSVGGRVILARNALELPSLPAQSDVRLINTVPSAMAELVRIGGVPDSVLTVNLAGEPLNQSLVQEIYQRTSASQVWNLYGPSEDTTYSTCAYIARDRGAAVTIGRPIANTQTYLLDSTLHCAPVGAAGELHLGGDGLAAGYLNRPGLTAEKFIPDPFGPLPGRRMYRTGDLGRSLPNGTIDFLGRIDNQIKLRGFRIELGEVEAALRSHPGVWESVVVLRGLERKDPRLVAYVVSSENWPGATALRAYLDKRLPGYMVPPAFVRLDSMPLTPNGKIDRHRLPEPDLARPEVDVALADPRTPMEEMVAGIWSDLLGVERVGARDDFFKLGGHSLLATRVASRVRDVFGVELPLRQMFENATVQGVAEIIERARSAGEGRERPAMRSIERGESLPLSYSQERLWFLEQLAAGGSAYNISGGIRLRGPLNVQALNHSLNEIIRRHEVLRTVFGEVDGRPAQTIVPHSTQPAAVVDIEGLERCEKETQITRYGCEDAQRAFDLTQAPLLRMGLLRPGTDDHALMLSLHHIAGDGWSMGILLREVSTLYQAYSSGAPSSLPEMPLQYADFAIWQRSLSEDAGLEEDLAYWRRQLRDAPEPLDLPIDYPRPVVQTFHGARQTVLLSRSLTDELKTLSRREGCTLFITLLASLQTLLFRYTGQTDIVVGSPIAGRNRAEIEDLLGFFINILALRTDLSGDPSFREVLRRTREAALGAYAHQNLPFERLLQELQHHRDLGRAPLFQVFLNMLNFASHPIEMPGLQAEIVSIPEVESKFDLTLYVREQDQGLELDLVYNTSLFCQERMAEMLEQYKLLLAAAAQAPQEKIGHYSLITPATHRLLPNPAVRLDSTWEGSVHRQFRRQALMRPENTAVVDERESYTYKSLDSGSNQLANYLIAQGIKPQDVVAIYSHRSAPLVLALLGVIKAGAAFLILDPAYPAPRLLSFLETAKPRGGIQIEGAGEPPSEVKEWVTGLACQLKLGNGEGEANSAFAAYPSHDPGIEVGPEDIAYVAFTSGSTGIPKGIAGKHGALAHFAGWAREMFAIGPGERYSMLSGLSHDPLHRDVFQPLQLGAAICVPNPEYLGAPERLAAWMARQRVTIANLTPAMGQVMSEAVRDATAHKLPCLRYVFFVGDALTRRDVNRLRLLAPSVQVVNLYGTTETSRAVGYYVVADEDLGGAPGARRPKKEALPLGRGISEVQLLVLNGERRMAGVGEVGEVFFRSPHLAKGYVGNEALTRERFVVNPYTSQSNDRLYRTGDLGRYLPNGNLESLGRADTQVKIRGFRVELGEIEAVLGRHPSVRECAAAAVTDRQGDKKLIGYVVRKEGEELTAGELRKHIKRLLPDYMVPSFIVTLDALPLTQTGKRDRGSLAQVDIGRLSRAAESPEARTPLEAILAAIWAEVLGPEWVGTHDDFFEIGGHSLLATQVVARIRARLGVELPLRKLFESPTVSQLAEALEPEVAGQTRTATIQSASRDQDLPLSFPQERLWFLDQLQPGLAVYNIPGALRLDGPLSPAALRQSLNEIGRRHEVLRTSFGSVKGQPVQVISQFFELDLAVVDLTGLAAGARKEQTAALCAAEWMRPFNLKQGSLLRVRLLRIGKGEHVLAITMHHIISDGWSLGVLVREFAAIYAAITRGEASPLPKLGLQYVDFSVWQRQWMQGEALDRQLSYWKQQLAGVPDGLVLPLDRPRPAVQAFNGARVPIHLSSELSSSLRSRCNSHGTTVFMALLSVFSTLLHRYTSQGDVVVGTPIANRNRLELEQLIGFFANTLTMRTRLSSRLSYQEVESRVRQTALGAYAHPDLPFEKLVEALQPNRNLSHNPLFQIMFATQNAAMEPLTLPGLRLEAMEPERAASPFDLVCTLRDDPEGISGILQYDTALFDRVTIERMRDHLTILLRATTAFPQTIVGELPLLTEGEGCQLMIEWNDTDRCDPPPGIIHQMFEEQAARSPNAVAAVLEQGQITYAELNRRANQLSQYLQKRGVGPEAVVAICLERSLDMLVTLLGVLKAGGSYLPLDPAFPAQRLAFMIADARPLMVATDSRLARSVPANGTRLLLVDAEADEISREGSVASPSAVTPENAAYVIYTSGSTGRPKGVQVRHSAVANFLGSMRQITSITAEDVLLAVTTLSFDIAALELYLPLTSGARVEITSREAAADGTQLLAALGRSDATLMQATPATWRLLVESGWQGRSSLRILCGGEALTRGLANHLLDRTDSLLNVYGPTETTIWSAARRIESRGGSVDIGQPIANTRIYILDPNLCALPAGAPGELYIGGAGLARGYLNRPARTAAQFIPDPFAAVAGQRLYRTGDLTRYRTAGSIEFLGRADNQVKIRGFRIEPGEIEAALTQNPVVAGALVVPHESSPGDRRLVAYVVARRESQGGEAEPGELKTASRSLLAHQLRSDLKQNLPSYMVPSNIVVLDGFPLTPNGKVDRKALPAPELSAAHSAPGAEPPNETQEILSTIWAQTLGLERIGVRDDFFECGGHSLLATRLIHRLQEAFGVTIPLSSLFEAPTVEGLARRIDAAMRNGVQTPGIRPAPRQAHLPLSFAQQRLWILHQLEPEAPTYNQHTAIRLTGPLNSHALDQALTEIVRRHEALRTTFATVNGGGVQVISRPQTMRVAIADFGETPGFGSEESMSTLATEMARRPFDLTSSPLLRTALLQLGAEDHVVLLNIHHIAFDAWSNDVLVNELSALYEAFATGDRSSLPEPRIQYADFAIWQRQSLGGAAMDRLATYWRRELEGAPSVLRLPVDHPKLASSLPGESQSFQMSSSLADTLQSFSRGAGCTLFMTLLAGFKLLLHSYSGQRDLIVGTNVANRSAGETDDLIGFFINLLPLRTRLHGSLDFRELVACMRRTVLGAIAHQDLPFERLIQEIGLERGSSETPLVQAVFQLHRAPSSGLKLRGLECRRLEAHVQAVPFPLVLNMTAADASLLGLFQYDASLLESRTITRMIERYEMLLWIVMQQPDLAVREVMEALEASAIQRRREKKQRMRESRTTIGSIKGRARNRGIILEELS